MTERQPFAGIKPVVVSAMVTAVFAVILLQKLFALFLIGMICKERVDSQPILCAASAKYFVDLISRDVKMPLRVVILGGDKSDWFPLQVLKLIGYFFRSVKSKPKNVRILRMGIGKSFPFRCYFGQHIWVN